MDNDNISAPPENAPLLSWASQVSLASKDEQMSKPTYQSTYQLSDHDSSDMDTQTCIFVCPSKVKKFVTVSASNSSAASTSKQPDQMGPPLGVPVVLNGLCFSLLRNILYSVKDFYKNGDVRLQDPAAPLKSPSDLIGFPSSLDNTQESCVTTLITKRVRSMNPFYFRVIIYLKGVPYLFIKLALLLEFSKRDAYGLLVVKEK